VLAGAPQVEIALDQHESHRQTVAGHDFASITVSGSMAAGSKLKNVPVRPTPRAPSTASYRSRKRGVDA
jgi:phosphomannomutase